ncbi:MAG: hypothetical protein WC824_15640 [Bacteroidota bacterium]
MTVHIFYWYGPEISHYVNKKGERSNCGDVPVAPSFPNLPPQDSIVDLTAEEILVLSRDFDVQIKNGEPVGGIITLHLDRWGGGHRQR